MWCVGSQPPLMHGFGQMAEAQHEMQMRFQQLLANLGQLQSAQGALASSAAPLQVRSGGGQMVGKEVIRQLARF